MNTLTVACVLVKGHVRYTPEYVSRLLSMCHRHIVQPFEFVCLTDQPDAMPPGVRAIKIKLPPQCKGWWAKLELFKPGRFKGRVLYLDLDSLIIAPLDDVIAYAAPFALAPDGAPNFRGNENLAVVKRFNSSVMIWDSDVVAQLYRDWTPAVAARLWGDQDWIGEQCPDAAAMPLHWFPRLSVSRSNWGPSAKVVLCKAPKNLDAARLWPWFDEMWQ